MRTCFALVSVCETLRSLTNRVNLAKSEDVSALKRDTILAQRRPSRGDVVASSLSQALKAIFQALSMRLLTGPAGLVPVDSG